MSVLGTPLVLFRGQGGRPAALVDRCAHRNVPLSAGRMVEGTVECAYHGWRFDAGGVCRLVPALLGSQEGRARRVPTHAARERQGYVWVWGAADAEPSGEPFEFPHVIHVKQGIACTEYCHAGVTTGPVAGIPGISTCMTCHDADSCRRCHEELRPQSHAGMWGEPLDRHCLSCHEPLRSSSCGVCHSGTPSHEEATPLPPDHNPGMNCRMCHGNGQPLPHVDNGQTCTSCHR